MAQASKAIVPRDVNGPFAQRIGVSVGGSNPGALLVGAYVTHRVNPTDWLRYSLLVLNWCVLIHLLPSLKISLFGWRLIFVCGVGMTASRTRGTLRT